MVTVWVRQHLVVSKVSMAANLGMKHSSMQHVSLFEVAVWVPQTTTQRCKVCLQQHSSGC